ncbi:MAG: hypothetical protein U0271_31320 [Polyangiaceae bacterium]
MQRVDHRFGYFWFVAPNVFINQAHIHRANAAAAHAVQDWIDALLTARKDSIAAAGGLIAVHDWRKLEGYDSDARRIYSDRMRRRPTGYLKAAYAIVPDTPLFKMAVQAINLVAAVGAGGRIVLAHDPADVLARLKIETPNREATFPEPKREP